MIQNRQVRFDYLLNMMLNSAEPDLQMELTTEEQEFFKGVDLTEVLFI